MYALFFERQTMIDFQKIFQLAEFKVEPTIDTVSFGNQSIAIKSMAMKILCYLASHEGQLVTRDDLRERVWNNSTVSDHAINNHIYGLRRALSKLDPKAKYIHTVTGTGTNGYRLNARITQSRSEPFTHPLDLPHEFCTEKLKSGAKKTKLDRPNYIYLFLSILLVLIIVYFTYRYIVEPTKYNTVTAITSHEGREQSSSVSEDGEILIYSNRVDRTQKWQLYASRVNDFGNAKKIFNDPFGNDNFVSISPDKKKIAFIRYKRGSRGIYLADFDAQSLQASNAKIYIKLSVHNLSPSINWLNNNQFFYNAKETPTAPLKFYLYNIALNISEQITSPAMNTFGDLMATISPNKKWLALMRSDGAFGYQLYLLNINTKDLVSTPVYSNEMRTGFSFSDNSQHLYFIDEQGYFSKFDVYNSSISKVSDKQYIGYWPIKIYGKPQFIMQQDWGLSSLTTQIIKHANPLKGGDGVAEVIVKNNMSIRAIEGVGNGGLIFASVGANYKIQLWRYEEGVARQLSAFNEKPKYKPPLSLNWQKGSNKALLSLNKTCRLVNIDTGKDTPLCPFGENFYAGRFSLDANSLYLAGFKHDKPNAVKLAVTGYPLTKLSIMANANTIVQHTADDFYYSEHGSYDIYYYNSRTLKHIKLISRTYISNPYSVNDFIVTKRGIYYMDRVKIRENAIYYYDFNKKTTEFVIHSKDNYPNIVLSDDEQYIYLIQSYDNNSNLLLVQ